MKFICFRDEEANAEEGAKRKKRKAIRYQSKRWTNKVIPYRVTYGFSKLSTYLCVYDIFKDLDAPAETTFMSQSSIRINIVIVLMGVGKDIHRIKFGKLRK